MSYDSTQHDPCECHLIQSEVFSDNDLLPATLAVAEVTVGLAQGKKQLKNNDEYIFLISEFSTQLY